MSTNFEILEKIGLTSLETRVVFNKRTRDNDDLIVYKDELSGVIYMGEHYTGDDTYIEGTYRGDDSLNFERLADADRRFEKNKQFVVGKDILDFGCGAGDFLHLSKHSASSVQGVELQANYIDSLEKSGISCTSKLLNIKDNSFDSCFSFHVIEHLPDPVSVLKEIKRTLRPDGVVIIEVPHANDLLLSMLELDSFKQFTLWSQHLVLHTRDSLERLLAFCGFIDITVQSAQRYSLANHMNWMQNDLPGGHKTLLSVLENKALKAEYENALASIDASDTLVIYAKNTSQ